MPYRLRDVLDFRSVQVRASVEVKMLPPDPTATKRSLPQAIPLRTPVRPPLGAILRILQELPLADVAIKPGSPTATKRPLAQVTARRECPVRLGVRSPAGSRACLEASWPDALSTPIESPTAR